MGFRLLTGSDRSTMLTELLKGWISSYEILNRSFNSIRMQAEGFASRIHFRGLAGRRRWLYAKGYLLPPTSHTIGYF